MKFISRLITFLVIVGIVGLVMKPNFEKHQEKIKRTYSDGKAFGGLLSADRIMAKTLTYHSRYIFSYTTLPVKDKIFSVGAFGYVYVPKADLRKILDELKKEDIFKNFLQQKQ